MLRRRQNTINANVFLGNRTSNFLYEPTTALDLIVRRNANITGNLTIGQDFRATNIYASGNYYLDNYVLIPAGTVIQSASVTTPEGWLDCIGQALTRSEYPDLFTAIGTTYGNNSSNDFKLPDLRDRCVIGLGNGVGLTNRDLGTSGGEENHTLSVNEMPSHTHDIPKVKADDGNFSNIDGQYPSGDAFPDNISRPINTIPTYSTGGNIAHNNMQPFMTLRFLIKY